MIRRLYQDYLDIPILSHFWKERTENVKCMWSSEEDDVPKQHWRYRPYDPAESAALTVNLDRGWNRDNSPPITAEWCPHRECWILESKSDNEWMLALKYPDYKDVVIDGSHTSYEQYGFNYFLESLGSKLSCFSIEQILSLYAIRNHR